MVDVIFADVAQPDQARIVALNAESFLKNGGHAVISIKANCIDSTAPAQQVFAAEVATLQKLSFKPLEQVTLEPYERVRSSCGHFVSVILTWTAGPCHAHCTIRASQVVSMASVPASCDVPCLLSIIYCVSTAARLNFSPRGVCTKGSPDDSAAISAATAATLFSRPTAPVKRVECLQGLRK